MARVTCVDCGGEVIVDPTGRCPEGHMLGPAGSRVDHAIGTDTPHPDEPEPWIATIEPDEVEGQAAGPHAATDGATRLAQPVKSPGPAAASSNGTVDTDTLFNELHTLSQQSGDASPHTSNGTHAPQPTTATPAPADAADTSADPQQPSSIASQPSAPVEPTQTPPADATPTGPTTSPRRNGDTATELSDLASLEAMLQELSESPGAATGQAAGPDHTQDADAAGDRPRQEPAIEAPGVEIPPAPPAHARDRGEPTTPPPPPAAAPEAAAPSPPADDGLDLSNFTAKGRKVSGKGRRSRR